MPVFGAVLISLPFAVLCGLRRSFAVFLEVVCSPVWYLVVPVPCHIWGALQIRDRSRPVVSAASVIGCATRPVLILATGLGFAMVYTHFGPRTLRTQDTSDLPNFKPRTLRHVGQLDSLVVTA